MRLERCNFTDGVIKPGFLSTINMEVKKLEIVNSGITTVLVGAFNSTVFGGTLTSLSIDNSWSESTDAITMQLFASEIFAGLTSLMTLEMLNIHSLNIIDKFSFMNLAESLTTLKIRGISSQWNPADLLSMVTMKKLSLVDLSNGNFASINGSMFNGIADSVIALYLQSSSIKSVDPETFKDFKSLRRLYLQNNLMKNINPKVFEELMKIPLFKVNLQDNIWSCVCDALPLKLTLISSPSSFEGTTKCFAPEELKGKALVTVHLCSDDETTHPEDTTAVVVTYETTTTDFEFTTKSTKEGDGTSSSQEPSTTPQYSTFPTFSTFPPPDTPDTIFPTARKLGFCDQRQICTRCSKVKKNNF